jgi:hypothetical protein
LRPNPQIEPADALALDRFRVPIEAYFARLERGEATFARIDA